MNPKNGYFLPSALGFGEALRRVEEGAAAEGFRVLKVHDVQAMLREKGFQADPTVIVEVCHAALASQALALDPEAALMMPCKVVLQEKGGKVTVSTLLPEAAVKGKAMEALVEKAEVKLKSLVDSAAGRSVPAESGKAPV
jgi:uncharacterized protein (DUF302 family)